MHHISLVELIPGPPGPPLFPYTTLFRSSRAGTAWCWQVPACCSSLSACCWTPAMSGACSGIISGRSEEHTSELQSRGHLVCRLLLEKKKMVENSDVSSTHLNCNYMPNS